MKRTRWSPTLLELIGVVALAAILFGVVAHAPDALLLLLLMAEILVSLGLLATAILGIIYRRGEKRAFWVGFSLFGMPCFLWILILLVFWFPGPRDAEILLTMLLGVPVYAWIGGSIGRRFAAPPPLPGEDFDEPTLPDP